VGRRCISRHLPMLDLLPVVHAIRASGVTTLAGVAEALNARGIRSARGGCWRVPSVQNLLARA
jgi:hypothetical protein